MSFLKLFLLWIMDPRAAAEEINRETEQEETVK
jgi:hypothetical protein